MSGKDVILYDGVCGMCNAVVKFVLKWDKNAYFLFAPLQGETAKTVLSRHGRNASLLDTVYVVRDFSSPTENLLNRAPAVLYILKNLDGPWRFLTILNVLPTSLLNVAYVLIGKMRYKFFGRYQDCPLPTPQDRARFI